MKYRFTHRNEKERRLIFFGKDSVDKPASQRDSAPENEDVKDNGKKTEKVDMSALDKALEKFDTSSLEGDGKTGVEDLVRAAKEGTSGNTEQMTEQFTKAVNAEMKAELQALRANSKVASRRGLRPEEKRAMAQKAFTKVQSDFSSLGIVLVLNEDNSVSVSLPVVQESAKDAANDESTETSDTEKSGEAKAEQPEDQQKEDVENSEMKELKEIFEELKRQLDELLGKLKDGIKGEDSSEKSDGESESNESAEAAADDVSKMKTSAIDTELESLEKQDNDFDKQIDEIGEKIAEPGENDNIAELSKQLSELSDKKEEIAPRKEALEAEKKRRTDLIASEWEKATTKDGAAKEPAVTGVGIEGDYLVLSLSEGGSIDTIKSIAKDAGFDLLADGRMEVPAQFYAEGLEGARQAIFDALAKIENKGATAETAEENPSEEADGGAASDKLGGSPAEGKESIETPSDRLNTKNKELLETVPEAARGTRLFTIFQNMEYKMAQDNQNIVVHIKADQFDNMLALAHSNSRTVTDGKGKPVQPGDNPSTVVVNGGVEGPPWTMTRGQDIEYPCYKAWGGQEGDVESQVASAEAGMDSWAGSLVSQETINSVDTSGLQNLEQTTVSTEQTGNAQQLQGAIESFKQSLKGDMKDVPLAKFISGMEAHNGEGNSVDLLCTESTPEVRSEGDKEFAYFLKDLFVDGTAAKVDTETGRYVVNLTESQIDGAIHQIGRYEGFLGDPSKQPSADFEEPDAQQPESQSEAEASSEEVEEKTPEQIKEEYDIAVDTIVTSVEALKFHIQDENGGMDSLLDDGSVAKGSTLETLLKDINDQINNPDLQIPEGENLAIDLGKALTENSLFDTFTDGTGAEYRLYMEDGIGVQRIVEDAIERNTEQSTAKRMEGIRKDMGNILANKSSLSANEKALLRNAIMLEENEDGSYTISIEKSLLAQGGFTEEQNSQVREGLYDKGARWESIPMSTDQVEDYYNRYVTRVNRAFA